MIKKLFVISACMGGVAGAAQAETWRMRPELIDQWSLFTCLANVPPDRVWDFTLEGSRLSASGPEGATLTATVAEGGAFKAPFTGYWRGKPFAAEMTGNVETKWAMFHNITASCWFKLVLQ